MKIISNDEDYEVIDDSDPDERELPGTRCEDCREVYDSFACQNCTELHDIKELKSLMKEGEIWD